MKYFIETWGCQSGVRSAKAKGLSGSIVQWTMRSRNAKVHRHPQLGGWA